MDDTTTPELPFLVQVLGSNTFEIATALITLLAVYLTTRRNMWCWPVSIISVIMYARVFYDYKLYSDMLLQIYYLVMSVYGWWYWSRGFNTEDGDAVPVTWLVPQRLLAWVLGIATGTMALGYLMANHTDADLPYPDAFTTVASLVAQYWMTRKYVQCWIAWIVIDVACVAIYSYKGMNPTAVLYFIFLFMASYGFMSWGQAWQRQAAPTGPTASAAS